MNDIANTAADSRADTLMEAPDKMVKAREAFGIDSDMEIPAFSEADANADGQVTMEEAKVALPDMDEATIAAADANGDGALDEAEYTALTAS